MKVANKSKLEDNTQTNLNPSDILTLATIQATQQNKPSVAGVFKSATNTPAAEPQMSATPITRNIETVEAPKVEKAPKTKIVDTDVTPNKVSLLSIFAGKTSEATGGSAKHNSGKAIETPKSVTADVKHHGQAATDKTDREKNQNRYVGGQKAVEKEQTAPSDMTTLISKDLAKDNEQQREAYKALLDKYPKFESWVSAADQKDFAEKSKYNQQYDSSKVNHDAFGNVWYSENDGDLLYDYINGNSDAVTITEAMQRGAKTYAKWQNLPQETKDTFNYIYATEGKDAAYDYMQMLEDIGDVSPSHLGTEAIAYGFMQGSGALSTASAIGAAINPEAASAVYTDISKEAAESAQQYKGLYNVGNIAGNVALMTATGAGVEAAGSWLSKIPGVGKWASNAIVKAAAKSGATMGTTRAISEAGATATGQQTVGKYVQNIVKSTLAGAAGGATAQTTANLLTALGSKHVQDLAAQQLGKTGVLSYGEWAKVSLAKSGMLPAWAAYTNSVLSGVGFAGADALTTYLLSEDGSEDKTTKAIVDRMVSAFLFSTISSGMNLLGYADTYNTALESEVNSLKATANNPIAFSQGAAVGLGQKVSDLSKAAAENSSLKTPAERAEWVRTELLKEVDAYIEYVAKQEEGLTATGRLYGDVEKSIYNTKQSLEIMREYLSTVSGESAVEWMNASADAASWVNDTPTLLPENASVAPNAPIVPTDTTTPIEVNTPSDNISNINNNSITLDKSISTDGSLGALGADNKELPQYVPQTQTIPTEAQTAFQNEMLSKYGENASVPAEAPTTPETPAPIETPTPIAAEQSAPLPQYTPREETTPTPEQTRIGNELLEQYSRGTEESAPMVEETIPSAEESAPTQLSDFPAPTKQQLAEANFDISTQAKNSDGVNIGPFNFSVVEKHIEYSSQPTVVGYIKDPDGNVIAEFNAGNNPLGVLYEDMFKAITEMDLPIGATADEYRAIENKLPTVATPNPETGKLYTEKLYHGQGKTSAEVYNSLKVPFLGKGTYYAMSEKAAKEYGENITERQVTLDNPFVIRDDSDLYKISKGIGSKYTDPYPVDGNQEEAAAVSAKIKDYLVSKGYDGVVVQYEYEQRGDINYKTGGTVRALNRLLGGDQVVSYKEEDRLPGSLHEESAVSSVDTTTASTPAETTEPNPTPTVTEIASASAETPTEHMLPYTRSRPMPPAQSTRAVSSAAKLMQAINDSTNRGGFNAYTTAADGKGVMVSGYAVLALNDSNSFAAAGVPAADTIFADGITRLYNSVFGSPNTDNTAYVVDAAELKKLTPKGKLKVGNDPKARFVEIGGNYFNAQCLSPILSTIDNPVINLAVGRGAANGAYIQGDNGVAYVLPIRPGNGIEAKTVYNAYTLDGSTLMGVGGHPAGVDAVQNAQDETARSVVPVQDSDEKSLLSDYPKDKKTTGVADVFKSESSADPTAAVRPHKPGDFQPVPKRNAAEPTAKTASAIIDKAMADWGFNVTKGHMRGQGRGTLGYFRFRDDAIRLRDTDVATFAHEFGHAMDNRYGLLGQCTSAPNGQAELTAAGGVHILNPAYRPSERNAEGLAEFVRKYLTDPVDAASKYPTLTDVMRKNLTPKELAKLDALANNVNTYFSHALDGEGTKTVLREDRPTDPRSKTQALADGVHQFYQNWADKYHSLKLIDDAIGTNAHTLAINSEYIDGRVESIITRHLTDLDGNYIGPGLLETLSAAGIKGKEMYQDLGDYLQYREAEDYISRDLKLWDNPITEDLQYAREQADKILQKYENVKGVDIAAAAENYYRFVDNLVDLAVDNSLIPEEVVEEWRLKKPNHAFMYRQRGSYREGGITTLGKGGQKNIANQQNPVKGRHGSTNKVINPIDNAMDAVANIVTAATKNRVMLAIADAVRDGRLDATIIETIPAEQARHMVNTNTFKSATTGALWDAITNGTTTSTDIDALTEDFEAVLNEVPAMMAAFGNASPSGDVVTVMRNGRPEWYKVNDKLLLQSLTLGMNPKNVGGVLDQFAKLTRFVSGNLTANNVIWSLGSNAPRDFVTMVVRSPETLKTLANYMSSYANYFKANYVKDATLNPYYEEYLALGGNKGGEWQADINFAKNLRTQITDSTLQKAIRDYNPLAIIQSIAEAVESGPRYAVYKTYRMMGYDAQASFEKANDAMTNFRRGGVKSKEVGKLISFFGASIQGPDAFYRWLSAADYKGEDTKRSVHANPIPPANGTQLAGQNASNQREQAKYERAKNTKESRAKTRKEVVAKRLTKFLMLTGAIETAKYLWNHRDEETTKQYNALSNYTKFNNWVFMGSDGKTKVVIPKNREMAVLSSLLGATLDQSMGNDYEAFEGMTEYATENLLPKIAAPTVNTIYQMIDERVQNKAQPEALDDYWSGLIGSVPIVGPLEEIRANSDYLGRPIINENKNQANADYYNDSTTLFGKLLGGALNLKPQQIDHFADSTLGYIWDYAEALTPAGGREKIDPTFGISKKYSKDVAYSQDTTDWLYDYYADAEDWVGSLKDPTADDYYKYNKRFADATFYKKYYENFSALNKNTEDSDVARALKLEMLFGLEDYREYAITSEGDLTSDAQQWVYDTARQANEGAGNYSVLSKGILPEVMSTKVSVGTGKNKVEYELTADQYLDYQQNYLTYYWNGVSAVMDSTADQEQSEEAISLARDTAKEIATLEALKAVGADYDEDKYDYLINNTVTNPLQVKYYKADSSIVDAIIDMDTTRTGNSYNFAPSVPTYTSITNPQGKNSSNPTEYVLDDEWKAKREEKYYELYNEKLSKVMSSTKYKNAETSKREQLLREARNEISSELSDWLIKEMKAAGVQPTPKNNSK